MGGAGRPGPVCGGMARDETFTRAAQPGASPRPVRVEAGLAGRNRGRGPKGTPCLCPCKRCLTVHFAIHEEGNGIKTGQSIAMLLPLKYRQSAMVVWT